MNGKQFFSFFGGILILNLIIGYGFGSIVGNSNKALPKPINNLNEIAKVIINNLNDDNSTNDFSKIIVQKSDFYIKRYYCRYRSIHGYYDNVNSYHKVFKNGKAPSNIVYIFGELSPKEIDELDEIIKQKY